MDIRVTESIATQGGLRDVLYRVDPGVEPITLNWDPTTGRLAVIDPNLNYSPLPWELYGDIVKKVFLVKNVKDCGTGAITETVVLESNDGPSEIYAPGYNNSNEWGFNPAFNNRDQWYTSYVCTVRTWVGATPPSNGKGHIVYHPDSERFYINLTGADGTIVSGAPDTTNWRVGPKYAEWKSFLSMYMGEVMVSDPVYFIETQHIATIDLNAAILSEIKKMCGCCNSPKFNTSKVDLYMKLMQKRLAVWVHFNKYQFQDAACILETTRALCSQCLYNNTPC